MVEPVHACHTLVMPNNANFRLVPRSELQSQWPRLRGLLQPAVEQGNGEVDVDDILDLALQGRMFVFADDALAVTVEFMHYPRKTVMLVGFGAGKVRDVRAVRDTLEAAARHMDATSIQTYCQNPAMTRYYRRFGMEPAYTLLEKTL